MFLKIYISPSSFKIVFENYDPEISKVVPVLPLRISKWFSFAWIFGRNNKILERIGFFKNSVRNR